MKKGRRYTAPKKPADAAAGAPHVRKFMIQLFDREDGKAADWPLIAETLLAVAFDALDQSPHDPRVLTLLRRISAGSYNRLADGPADNRQPVRGADHQAGASFSATPSGPGHAEPAN